MAERIASLCIGHGCRNTAERGSYYCTTCRPRDPLGQKRESPTKRGYGAAWRRTRAAFLAEYPLCNNALGLHSGRLVAARVADHIVPREQGGTDDWSNLQPLCKRCHDTKTATQDNGFGRLTRPTVRQEERWGEPLSPLP